MPLSRPHQPSAGLPGMTRRSFVTSTAGLLALGSLGFAARGFGQTMQNSPSTARLIRHLVARNDENIALSLARQRRDPAAGALGAVDNVHGIPTAQDTARLIIALACAAHAPDSRWHRDPALAEALGLATAALVKLQHADGTIDLVETNFHSTPDTAFVLEIITAAAQLLRGADRSKHAAARAALETFIRRGGEALVVGGVHTPNHRWVVCGALARVHTLYPDSRYLDRMDRWLAEGIDLDADGQYTEKSTGVYSPVVNRALLGAARLLDRPELFEPVRRNLAMTLYYVHPDGELVTEASRRQDQYQRVHLSRYYMSYRAMALHDGDGRFAAAARYIESSAPDDLTGELATFFEEPEWQAELPPSATLPTDYARVFAHSHLARIRRDALSATILARNSTLFSLRKGAAALEAVRLASAFFGKGQFEADELEVSDGVYRLRQRLEGPYFQPLPPERVVPGAPVRMAPNGTLAVGEPNARATSEVQLLESVVEVRERDGGFTLDFAVTGTAGVPVALELAFRAGGQLSGVTPVAGATDSYLLGDSTSTYTSGDDVITFGPGRADHSYTQLRGARPKWAGQSVYLTGLTPFHARLELG